MHRSLLGLRDSKSALRRQSNPGHLKLLAPTKYLIREDGQSIPPKGPAVCVWRRGKCNMAPTEWGRPSRSSNADRSSVPHRTDSFRSEEHTSELQSRRDLVCRL